MNEKTGFIDKCGSGAEDISFDVVKNDVIGGL